MRNSLLKTIAPPEFEDIQSASERALRRAELKSEHPQSLLISTQIAALDKALNGGAERRRVTVISGGSATAQLELCARLAFNIASEYIPEVSENGSIFANQGGVVGLFSPAHSSENIATVIISQQTNIPFNNIQSGNISESDFAELSECSELMQKIPIYIDDRKLSSIDEVIFGSQSLKKKKNVDVIIIEDTNSLIFGKKNDKVKYFNFSRICEIAIDLDISVIIFSDSTAPKHEVSENNIDNISFSEFDLFEHEETKNPKEEYRSKKEEALKYSTRKNNDDFLQRVSNSEAGDVEVNSFSAVTLKHLVDALGGTSLLRRTVISPADLARLTQDGLPIETLGALTSRGLSSSEIEAIVAPKRTLSRRRSSGVLSPNEGDALVRLLRILLLSQQVFGDEILGLKWLKSEQSGRLGGKTPLEFTSTEIGAKVIEDILLRAIYGLTA